MRRRVLVEMMGDYFDTGSGRRSDPGSDLIGALGMLRSGGLPVSPMAASGEWTLQKSPRCLRRTYKFHDSRAVSDFLSEVMAHEHDTGHHGKITCEFPFVTVEVRTHDLDDITELDQAYARTCDHIYADVNDYRSIDSGEDDHGW